MHFENDQVIQGQLEKFTQRVLYSKYEFETLPDSSKKKEESSTKGNEHELSKCKLNEFLQFFNLLASKSQDSLKACLTDSCTIKSVKKAG